jgi:hypothetical protein
MKQSIVILVAISLLAACSSTDVVRNSPTDGSVAQVERWLASNWLDLHNRQTIEWGQVEQDESGNYTVRYRFQANVAGGGALVDDTTFTFDRKGKFVSVNHAEGFPEKIDN